MKILHLDQGGPSFNHFLHVTHMFDRVPPRRLFMWLAMWLTGLFLEGGIFERPCASVQPAL